MPGFFEGRLKRWTHRSRWSHVLVWFPVTCVGFVWGCSTQPPREPDVLILTLDTFRADYMGCTGGPVTTPVLDSLAVSGCLFEQHVCQVPLTLPSHASLMTGLYPYRHGLRVNGQHLSPDGPRTLAEHLKSAGYTTAAFLGAFPLASGFGLSRGFDHYDDNFLADTERQLPEHDRRRQERRAGEVVQTTLTWLGDHASPKPLFLWVHLYDPHDPYDPPEGFRPGYAGEIEYVDTQVGRLLAGLDARRDGDSNARPLLVLVAGDHGEGLAQHDEPTHGLFVYDTTMLAPLLVAGPGVVSGRRLKTAVQTVDLLPTILDLLGFSRSIEPASLDGRSFGSSLRGGQEPTPRPAYMESQFAAGMGWAPLRAVRSEGWKYVEAPDPELYDLTRDPRETVNRLAEEPARARSLATMLASFSTTDPGVASGAPSRAELDRLRSLGYVGEGPVSSSDTETRRDPKQMTAVALLLTRAEAYALAGSTQRAIQHFRTAHAADPTNPFIALRLGNLYKSARRFEDAIASYRLGIGVALDPGETTYQLADAYFRSGQVDSALVYFERSAALEPRRAAAFSNLGTCLVRVGRVEEAQVALERAVLLDPDDWRSVGGLGATHLVLGHRDQAQTILRRARDLHASDPAGRRFPYHFELGLLLAHSGELEAAAGELARVEGSRKPQALHEAAVVAVQRGRGAEGAALVEAAIALGGEPLRKRIGADPRLAPIRSESGATGADR